MLPVRGISRSHGESQALLYLPPPPPACAPTACCCSREAALPPRHDILCAARVRCGLAHARCEHAPATFYGGERWGRALLTGAAADPSGLCPCQLRCPRLLCKHPCYPGNPNLAETLGSPWPAAEQPNLSGKGTSWRWDSKNIEKEEGPRELRPLLLLRGNKRDRK